MADGIAVEPNHLHLAAAELTLVMADVVLQTADMSKLAIATALVVVAVLVTAAAEAVAQLAMHDHLE
jgi:hypothetical protein